jgi:hypothetical protein
MDALEPAPAEPPCLLLTLPRELLSKVVFLTVDKFEEPLWTYSLSARYDDTSYRYFADNLILYGGLGCVYL